VDEQALLELIRGEARQARTAVRARGLRLTRGVGGVSVPKIQVSRWRSARRADRAADCFGGGAHAGVVGDQAMEVAAELLGGGEVDRVEGSQLFR